MPLNPDTVAEWEELTSGTQGNAASAVGRAFATAVLPGVVGMLASAGLGAMQQTKHTVAIGWADGNQSLIELPEKLFNHFAVHLKHRRAAAAAPTPEAAPPPPAAQPDVTRADREARRADQGALTEAEFATKKAELLARL